MTGANKVNWSIWKCPVGPEVSLEKQRAFHAPRAETLTQYDRLRQDGSDPDGLVVTDQNGVPVYACS